MRSANRVAPLDGLRAIAILIVMISHAGLGHIVPGGFGVTIFFFLSGYLITTIMVNEWEESRTIDFRLFYLKRAVRILPPMFIAIAIAVALALIGLSREIDYGALVWDYLFLSNYAPLLGGGSNIPIPLWSLAIEEHFYLLFPAVFLVLRKTRRNAALACAAMCLTVLAIRIAHVEFFGLSPNIYYWSHTRIDSILFGCVLATWNNPTTRDKTYIGAGQGYAAIGAALILLTLAIRDPVFRETWRYTLQGVGLFLLFNFALRTSGIVARVLSARWLKVVADLSYFLYLIHMPLLVAASYLAAPVAVQYAVAIAFSFLLAALVRRFVELPLLRWRKRIEAQPGVKVSTV